MEPGSWYWHRNLVERDREKRLLCERKGIRLITVYDHYDETAVPFDDCLVTPCDLASRRNMDKLVAVTKTLFGAFGLDSNLAAGEWETIRRRAELDSRRMTTEEFRAELAGINDKSRLSANTRGPLIKSGCGARSAITSGPLRPRPCAGVRDAPAVPAG